MAVKNSYSLLKIFDEPQVGRRCKIRAIRNGQECNILTSKVEDYYISPSRSVIKTKNSIYEGYEVIYPKKGENNE